MKELKIIYKFLIKDFSPTLKWLLPPEIFSYNLYIFNENFELMRNFLITIFARNHSDDVLSSLGFFKLHLDEINVDIYVTFNR